MAHEGKQGKRRHRASTISFPLWPPKGRPRARHEVCHACIDRKPSLLETPQSARRRRRALSPSLSVLRGPIAIGPQSRASDRPLPAITHSLHPVFRLTWRLFQLYLTAPAVTSPETHARREIRSRISLCTSPATLPAPATTPCHQPNPSSPVPCLLRHLILNLSSFRRPARVCAPLHS